MKTLIVALLVFAHYSLFAIKILPTASKSIMCTNNKTGKIKAIHQNDKITLWHNNDSTTIKTSCTLVFVDDSIAYIRKAGENIVTEIPIHTITGITKRNSVKLILSAVTFVPSSVLSVFTIKLLNDASNNRSNRGNGLAGVVGIVMGIIVFPFFIASTITLTKHLLYKKMTASNGWKFEANKN
jgi:hypothetical protein